MLCGFSARLVVYMSLVCGVVSSWWILRDLSSNDADYLGSKETLAVSILLSALLAIKLDLESRWVYTRPHPNITSPS